MNASSPLAPKVDLQGLIDAIALGLVMAVGAVLAKRLGNRRRRVAAT